MTDNFPPVQNIFFGNVAGTGKVMDHKWFPVFSFVRNYPDMVAPGIFIHIPKNNIARLPVGTAFGNFFPAAAEPYELVRNAAVVNVYICCLSAPAAHGYLSKLF